MAGIRRSCGTVQVNARDSRRDTGSGNGDTGDQQPTGGSRLPFIGPVTADNPRALVAGVALLGGTAFLATR